MRVGAILAAVAALWALPAEAAILVPNTNLNVLVVGTGTRVDFQLLDPLPAGAKVNLPNLNQFEFWVQAWDGTKRQTISVDFNKFDFVTKILSQTDTGFSIEYGFPGDFLNCDVGSPIGEICGSYHAAFANGSWYAVTTPDGNPDPAVQLNYTLAVRGGPQYNPTIEPPSSPVPEPASWALTILGIGIAGAAVRRNLSPKPSRMWAS